MKRSSWYAVLLIICLVFFMQFISIRSASVHSEVQKFPMRGSGSYLMAESTGINTSDLAVYYYLPEQWTPDRPVLIVQHGVQRNAKEFRDSLIADAQKYNFLLICPEFSKEKYPGAQYYNTGNMFDRTNQTDRLKPSEDWTFSAIDDVVNSVKEQFHATGEFSLFGHSAGAQFVHRYLLFYDHGDFSHIIFANAGWYTALDTNVYFPYGTKNITMLDSARLTDIFAKPVTMMLGEKDRKEDGVLRQTKEAEAQGPNRFSRGEAFFTAAQSMSATMHVPFNWKLATVPGVGHSDIGMAQAAIYLLFGDRQ